ncbi:outer membrane beta-barrel protein [Paraflavitalea sp. CAU 1676]|uniref:type IX secretion/gliding motility protein PorT/SprT n=1 Tax=Paraflavitalea sp. CAU 1676 TaxID=3032598 RepID=UPI0023DA35F1|nr:outer membrane beta-barrel protein [Paraflavitalea sp. CAU 1676]MDF2187472.1 outer membrane beta-barrel protein [Paraflavitalea sp. CAU 1676]
MYYLLRQKKRQLIRLAYMIVLLAASYQSGAQEVELNLPNHDDKKYFLGIGLIYNTSRFNITHHPSFLGQDSVLTVESQAGGGFGLAGLHTYRISKRFEVRAIFPQLLFSYKNLVYDLKTPDASKEEQKQMTKRVESILVGLPVHLKFRSDRIGNFRVYMFGGAKFEYDLASNSTARRAEGLVKLSKYDFGVEAGIGFSFYFPVFILSPEIKFSNGLMNTHSRDENLKFSNTIDKLNSRMVLFSLIFEG